MKQRAGSWKDHKSNKNFNMIGKEGKKRTEVTNVRNEIDFIADATDSERITWCQKLHTHKFDNTDELNQLFKKQKLY